MYQRCYSELAKLNTFKERFEYLKLDGMIGETTFGFNRYLNQAFYLSKEWKKIRDEIILRDNGCDLGVDGYELNDSILIHHINPITIDDIQNHSYKLIDPENLITTVKRTHNAIHYGDASLLTKVFVERQPNDTCPWKR